MRPPRMHRSAQRSTQSTEAPTDKQTHNQRQAEIFNRKTEAFSTDLPEDIKQAMSCLCASPKLLHWASHIANLALLASDKSPRLLTIIPCIVCTGHACSTCLCSRQQYTGP